MNNERENPGQEYIEQSEKQKRWDELMTTVDRMADRLGKGVDSGIRETLVGLMVHDLHTTASCEGHEDWATGGPYVDVESPNNVELHKKRKALMDKEDDSAEAERASLRDKITKNNLQERKKLIVLLDEFYGDRNVPFEIRLTINPLAMGWSRLENQGVQLQEIETDKNRKKEKLLAFQEEMRAFTEFLKAKYFSKPPTGY